MALIMRRGKYADFDPSKMREGEWAVVLADDPGAKDGKSIYICFSAGNVKRMATYEDMVENIEDASADIQNMFTAEIQEKIRQATKVINEGNTVITNSTAAIKNAEEAAKRANDAAVEIQRKADNGDFSATISGVSAVTGESGTQAKVENTGTAKDVNLVFTIPKGDSAGFGKPTATVDANIGVPSVTVKASGSDREKVFSFEFHNLKGEPGAEGMIDENSIVTFSQAEKRENIQSGETLVVLMGKIEKMFADLKNIAYTASYKDLTDAPYDFIGTSQELQAKIDAGEDLSGITAYLTDGGQDSDNGQWGGLGGVPLGDVKKLSVEKINGGIEISWSDPDDIVFNGETTAEFSGTKVLRKTESYSVSETDGILVLDSKIKDAYSEMPFQDVGLERDTEYFYTLFPYTTKNVYTMSDTNKASCRTAIYDPVLANNSWDVIALASEAGIAKDNWKVGDEKDGYMIIGFDHDDLADGSGKAGITFMLNDYDINPIYTRWCSDTNANKRMYNKSTLSTEVSGAIRGMDESITSHIKTIMKKNVVNFNNTGVTYEIYNYKIFLFSCYELNREDNTGFREGTIYEGCDDFKNISSYFWTRTPTRDTYNNAFIIFSNGGAISSGTRLDKNAWARYGFCI